MRRWSCGSHSFLLPPCVCVWTRLLLVLLLLLCVFFSPSFSLSNIYVMSFRLNVMWRIAILFDFPLDVHFNDGSLSSFCCWRTLTHHFNGGWDRALTYLTSRKSERGIERKRKIERVYTTLPFFKCLYFSSLTFFFFFFFSSIYCISLASRSRNAHVFIRKGRKKKLCFTIKLHKKLR